MIVSAERIKAAMDEHIANSMPPDGFYTSQWYVENIYPELNRQKVSFILASMEEEGVAIKSDRQYKGAWYYKIVTE